MIRVWQVLRWVEVKRQNTEDLRTVKMLCMITTDTYLYTFVQTSRMYSTKHEPLCRLRTLGDDDMSAQVPPW